MSAFHVFSSVLAPCERKTLSVDFHISQDLFDGVPDDQIVQVLADMLPVVVAHYRMQARDQKPEAPSGLAPRCAP